MFLLFYSAAEGFYLIYPFLEGIVFNGPSFIKKFVSNILSRSGPELCLPFPTYGDK